MIVGMEIDIAQWVILFFGTAAAGWVDAVIGGGGLILIPMLLAVLPGLAPAAALGTSKLAAVTGTGSRCSAGMGNAAQVRRLRPASTRPAADPARPDALLRHAPSAPRGSGRNLTALRYLPHCRPGLPLPRVRETFRTFERGTRLAGVHPASRPARRVSGHAGRIFGNNVRAELSFS